MNLKLIKYDALSFVQLFEIENIKSQFCNITKFSLNHNIL